MDTGSGCGSGVHLYPLCQRHCLPHGKADTAPWQASQHGAALNPRHLSRAVRSHRHPRVLSYRTEKNLSGAPGYFYRFPATRALVTVSVPWGAVGSGSQGQGAGGTISSEVQCKNAAFWLIELQGSAAAASVRAGHRCPLHSAAWKGKVWVWEPSSPHQRTLYSVLQLITL